MGRFWPDTHHGYALSDPERSLGKIRDCLQRIASKRTAKNKHCDAQSIILPPATITRQTKAPQLGR